MPRHRDVPPLPEQLRGTARNRVSNELNTTAIATLRRARITDGETGLTPERLSLLAVLVFAGPQTMSALARTEQVTRPAITRIVAALEADGLVRRETVPTDRRSVRVRATAAGTRVLEHGRRRRVETLAAALADLSRDELAAVSSALAVVRRGLAAEPPTTRTTGGGRTYR